MLTPKWVIFFKQLRKQNIRRVISEQQRLNCKGLLKQRADWRSEQVDICCSLNSLPAASWTLSLSWPPSRSPPCSLSALTLPAVVFGSSDAPLKHPSPSPSACYPPGAAAETWRWHRLQRSAQATQPSSGERKTQLTIKFINWFMFVDDKKVNFQGWKISLRTI